MQFAFALTVEAENAEKAEETIRRALRLDRSSPGTFGVKLQPIAERTPPARPAHTPTPADPGGGQLPPQQPEN